MKLVEILAKELGEWPESALCITQDSGGYIYGWEQAGAEYRGRSWYSPDGKDFGMHDIGIEGLGEAIDHKKSVVSQAQWQAERDRQNGGEWKRHRGGKQPIPDGVAIEVRWRDGEIGTKRSEIVRWEHEQKDYDIMAYKVISQPQAEEVEVKDTTIGTLSYKVEIDTTEASQAIDDLTAKWDQIETPFKWRDEVTELNAYIEKYTREREALINRLAEEGFALLPAMTPVMGVADISLPIEEWQIGDIVEVVSVSDESAAPLGVFKITDIDASEPKYELDDEYFPKHEQMKFIRRP